MREIYVYGHKNPDSDAICTSIAYANLRNIINPEDKSIPARIGVVNEETKYALEYFGVEYPLYIESVDGKNIIMIDHNERTHTADGYEQAKVIEVIDHHRVANFITSEPFKARIEPYGCTSTIVCEMYLEKNIQPSKQMAGMMLSAIISDTLLFKSPTCTQNDIEACKYLEKIAGVDMREYGMELLKAGTNLSSKTKYEILNMDMKEFQLNDGKYAISQVNTVNENDLLKDKDEFIKEMDMMIEKLNSDAALFVITNILTNDSVGIARGKNITTIERAFNTKLVDSQFEMKGVVSRKKQIVPPLTEAAK